MTAEQQSLIDHACDAQRELGGFVCDICSQRFKARSAPLVGLTSPDHDEGLRTAIIVCPNCRPSGPSNWDTRTVYEKFLVAALEARNAGVIDR